MICSLSTHGCGSKKVQCGNRQGSTELHASRTGSHCAQRLQPTRRFGYNALRLCTRQLHRARKQATETCAAAAVDAPSAADSSDSMDELSTKELYKRFDQLLSENKYKYKQGDRATQVLKAMEERDFIVVRDEWRGGDIRLSLRKAEEAICWKRVQQLMEENVTVISKVVQINKGGVMVEYANLDDLIGTELPVKFLEVEQERERLVFSARKASNEMRAFSIGDIAEGVIQSITPYGAFVDLGDGMSGLLHISQISHDRITNVGAILTEGDKIKVMVLSQDRERGRMSLSTKKLEPNPGDMLSDPQKVYDQADEMAAAFRQKLDHAESMARQEGVQF